MIKNREKNNIAKVCYADLIVKTKEEIIDICASQALVILKRGKEIERLNNIISELEKTFKRDLEGILDFEEKHPEAILSRFPEYYLEQLKEFKGSDKE